MSREHQVGYAMYVKIWDESKLEEQKATVVKKLNRFALYCWLKPSTDPHFILHRPNFAPNPEYNIGSVGVKEYLPHRWPEWLGEWLIKRHR